MKAAISIPDDLFEEVDKIARENNYSRSHLFCIAVKEYLEKVRSQRLLEALNKAYADEDTPDDKKLRKKSFEYYEKTILKKDNDDKTG